MQVFGELSTIDYGDAPTAPGYVEETLERIEDFVRPIAESAAVPVGIGGDHSVTLAELRALATVHGPLGLVHLDSHTDLWDAYNGLPVRHGTMFRRAIEEGILDPARMIQVGMRGPLYGEDDEAIPGDLGVETIPWLELAELDAGAARRSASARGSATARVPARSTSTSSTRRSAPAPARRRSAGRRASRRCSSYAPCTDLPFVGYDVVEVAPQYDGPGQVTALFAANAIFEMLSMIARRAGRGSRGSGPLRARSGRVEHASRIIGCGDVASRIYVPNSARFPQFDVVACADIDAERAQELAQASGIAALSIEQLLERKDVETVLNLTSPSAHEEVSLAVIDAGKHLYSEKPLAIDPGGAAEILAAASRRECASPARRTRSWASASARPGASCRRGTRAPDQRRGRDAALGPRALSPSAPACVLRAGRRAALRHGALLPHAARSPVRARRSGRGHGARHLSDAAGADRPGDRIAGRRHDAFPSRCRPAVRDRDAGDDDHELRLRVLDAHVHAERQQRLHPAARSRRVRGTGCLRGATMPTGPRSSWTAA